MKATDKRLNRLWVDEKHKIVYCNIPKVASTNWYRVFLKFAGMNATMVNEASLYDIHSNLKKNYLRRLADFGSEQREIIMRNYFKFMFVRNPLDRLLSAFKDRLLLKHGNAYFTEGLQIFKTFRSKKEIKSYGKEGTKAIQFEEFLQWIISWKNSATLNPHWRPYHLLCHPCGIHYDFIGKLETVADDTRYILEMIGEVKYSFPSRPYHNTSAIKKIQVVKQFKTKEQYFSSISPELLKKTIQTYYQDYELFDYAQTVPVRHKSKDIL